MSTDRTTTAFKDVYLSPRMLSMLALGFGSGVAAPLLTDNLQAWMTDAKVDLTRIGLTSLITLPLALKIVWAPLLDNYRPPILTRRRGWMLLAQIALVISLLAMAAVGNHSLMGLMLVATAAAFCSATFDIVADAYRADILPDHQRASGAAVWVTGYRIAMVALGAGALALSARAGISWPQIYVGCAGVTVIGIAATILSPEPPVNAPPAANVVEAFVRPIADILLRRGGWIVLVFVLLFKVPDYLCGKMTLTFLMKINVPKEEIAMVRQAMGIAITILGALVGGAIAPRLGMRKSLVVFGSLQAASNAGFMLLAWTGPSFGMLVGVIAVESFCAGLVAAGFTAYLLSQCDPRYSGTQLAAMTGLMTLASIGAGAVSGLLAGFMGWQVFFAFTILAGLPALFLIPVLTDRRTIEEPRGFPVLLSADSKD